MLRKNLITCSIILMLLSPTMLSFGQEENLANDVEIINPIEASFYAGSQLKSGHTGTTFKIRMFFLNGANIYNTAPNRNMVMNHLNEVYNQVGISFTYSGSHDTGSSDLTTYWYNTTLPYPSDWILIFVPDLGNNTVGRASMGHPVTKIDADYFFSESSILQKNLLLHEFGHNLGLLHTVYGTKYNLNNCVNVRGELEDTLCNRAMYLNIAQIPEYVNGSNGYTAGDLCKDTPADPFLRNTHPTDENGDQYESFTNPMKTYNNTSLVLTNDQKRIVDLFATSSTYGRLYPKSVTVPSEVSYGQSVYCYYTDNAPVNEGVYWTISKTLGGSSSFNGYWNANINQSTGEIYVNGDRSGTEVVSCNFKYLRTMDGSTSINVVQISYDIEINPIIIPSAPTISYPYNMSTHYYEANPLETGTAYRFQMTNCGNSTSEFDYEWTCDSYADYVFQDINGLDVQDGGTAFGKTSYFKVYEDGYYTLKARYRANSDSPWSEWATTSLNFQGGEMMMMMITPNPVSLSSTTISVESTSEKPLNYNEGWELEVVDLNYGKKVKEKVKNKDYKLKTHGWKAGTYIVVATYKDKKVTAKLKVE